MRPVFVLGSGAHPWGKFPEKPQLQLAVEALSAALAEAGLGFRDLGGLVAASSRFEGGMGWGLHANEVLQAVAEQGIPAINVGGGCAAGAIAVHVAAMMIASGECEIAAAFGAERMPKGFIPRPPGAIDDISDSDFVRWAAVGATNPAYWALEARRRMYEHGTSEETLADVVVRARRHAFSNPLARYRRETSVAEVLSSAPVCDPLHLLQICAVSDGAAAVVLGSQKQADRLGRRTPQIAASAVATGLFGDPAARIPTVASFPQPGVPRTSEVHCAVQRALERAGVEHRDVDFLEIADNSAWHVLDWPESLGFLEPGEADRWLERGDLSVGGRLPINPSGGFLSFGEATTAQGVLQVCELVRQLRGEAGSRQVAGARVAVSAVLGLGANAASIVLKV